MPTPGFDINELKRRMQGATHSLKPELGGLPTVSVPEPRLLSVQVWDKSMVKAVEKAIVDSNLGLSPATEGQVLRLRIPEHNQERLSNDVQKATDGTISEIDALLAAKEKEILTV